MSVTAVEIVESREATYGVENPGIVLRYMAEGAMDEQDILAEIQLVTPDVWNSWPRKSIQVSHQGGGIWSVTVTYAAEAAKETGESEYSFDTTGGTQHITQSLQTILRRKPGGGTGNDFAGAIGWNGNSLEGCDIVVPVYEFTEKHFIDNDYVTKAYKVQLRDLTGKVNKASFRGFEAGEVLFFGAQGQKRGQGDWEISFRFAAQQNQTGLDIGNPDDAAHYMYVDKKGWEYLWVNYQECIDGSGANKMRLKKPIGAYVEKVYRDGDFSLLGLGGDEGSSGAS